MKDQDMAWNCIPTETDTDGSLWNQAFANFMRCRL